MVPRPLNVEIICGLGLAFCLSSFTQMSQPFFHPRHFPDFRWVRRVRRGNIRFQGTSKGKGSGLLYHVLTKHH